MPHHAATPGTTTSITMLCFTSSTALTPLVAVLHATADAEEKEDLKVVPESAAAEVAAKASAAVAKASAAVAE